MLPTIGGLYSANRDICNLVGVCVPFGRRVGEWAFFRIYNYIQYTIYNYTFAYIYTTENWGIYAISIYILVLDICCQQLRDYILPTGMYVIWWVSVCPLSAGLGNIHFLEYTFVLDIHCQQLGNICHLNLYISIGYKLATIGGYFLLREASPNQYRSFFEHCSNGLWPSPPCFEHECCKFFRGTFKKVRKRLSQQKSTK